MINNLAQSLKATAEQGEGMTLEPDEVKHLAARIEALESENRKLRETLANVQYEAERKHGGLVHLKRAVSNAARVAQHLKQENAK